MSEETIFHEVDEALRRDRMHGAWRRFGPFVIGAAVGVVLLVAANEGWNWWQSTNSARSSDEFYSALDLESGGDLAGAQKALDTLIASGTGQYPVLARFKQAGLLVKQGKKDEALAAYDALANTQGNQRLKELALLLGANVLVDKGDVAGVKSHVDGLLAQTDPLHNSARETLGLAQYKAGDLNGARDSFAAVAADPLASNEQRQRVQLFIAQLVALGATPVAAAVQAGNAADAAAAAVQAIGAAPSGGTPAPAANDNAAGGAPANAPAADNSAPVGIESAQPATPDASLGLAVPAAPATTAPATSAPVLSTGTGLPTAPATDSTATQPAPAAGTTGQ
ncbi:MAG: tetratricopeptide repeat protein [Devosia sp.]|nr:tetratricopeptide repeat protein [Devosia sp.]